MAKVFLCYRREDSGGYAGRLQDRLLHDLGADVLFMDVDSIPIGKNFVKVLHDEVAKCEVLLAVIGRNWIDARDEHGTRRLDNPNDFVRIEISAALQRDIPVVPVLLEGVRIPDPLQLPKDIGELSVRNGIDVRHSSFHSDVDRLIRGLRRELNIDSETPETEHSRPQVMRAGAETKPDVSTAVADQALKNQSDVGAATGEVNNLRRGQVESLPQARRELKPSALAVGAVGGLLAMAFTLVATISTPSTAQEIYAYGILSIVCGGIAGIVRSQYGILIAVHVASVVWGLILAGFLVGGVLFGALTLSIDDAFRLLAFIFIFALCVFATFQFYERVCVPVFKRAMSGRMAP